MGHKMGSTAHYHFSLLCSLVEQYHTLLVLDAYTVIQETYPPGHASTLLREPLHTRPLKGSLIIKQLQKHWTQKTVTIISYPR